MQTITFTQLRTKSKLLKQSLLDGKTVKLIHRSQPLADIKPSIEDPKPFDAKKFQKIISALNLPKLTVKQARRRYRQHLLKKYGPVIYRH